MDTKPLLYGLIGFFIGGFVVSVAATIFDKPNERSNNNTSTSTSAQSSADSLKDKKGDEFDAAFISEMILHHEGAVEMSKLSASNAKHDELKQLSSEIISAQEKEIGQMKQWQKDWGYATNTSATSITNVHAQAAKTLKDKTGDEFDAAFISEMIVHHEGAVEMARLSAANAKYDEIKQLSKDIISAQEKEITQMKQWQTEWGYKQSTVDHNNAGH